MQDEHEGMTETEREYARMQREYEEMKREAARATIIAESGDAGDFIDPSELAEYQRLKAEYEALTSPTVEENPPIDGSTILFLLLPVVTDRCHV